MSSPFGPMILICNARSGRGGVARALPEVEQHLKERKLEYELRHTEGPGHATELAREALRSGIRFLVAVGGDGTVHEVVNGMIENDAPVDPSSVLGVVAAGTGSDFIKTFGIRSIPSAAVAHLDGEHSFKIDIGKVTYQQNGAEVVRYFPNIAEVGLGAAVGLRSLMEGFGMPVLEALSRGILELRPPQLPDPEAQRDHFRRRRRQLRLRHRNLC